MMCPSLIAHQHAPIAKCDSLLKLDKTPGTCVSRAWGVVVQHGGANESLDNCLLAQWYHKGGESEIVIKLHQGSH